MKKNITKNGVVIGYYKISEEEKTINLDDIEVFKSGTGRGTATIKRLIRLASKKNKIFTLTSDAMRGKENQRKNRKLYESLGFMKNSGKNKIKETTEEFYILPQ